MTGAIGETLAGAGSFIARNPGVAGGATAVIVAASFFTANAVLFQDGPHPSAFFETRPAFIESPAGDADAGRVLTDGEPNVTRFVLNPGDSAAETQEVAAPIPVPAPAPRHRSEEPARTVTVSYDPGPAPVMDPKGDETVLRIQELLSKLGYYEGPLDGLQGPMTNGAVEAYKKHVGLRGIDLTEGELMTSMRNNLDVTAAIPQPRPDESGTGGEPDSVEDVIAMQLPGRIPSAEVVKVQAALRAFGNTDVAVDGIAGDRTEIAIEEFQSLFKLPVTGKIDGALLEKMRDVGLVQ